MSVVSWLEESDECHQLKIEETIVGSTKIICQFGPGFWPEDFLACSVVTEMAMYYDQSDPTMAVLDPPYLGTRSS